MGTEGMEGDKFNSNDFSSRISDNDSLLCRGLFVMWESWGEKIKKKRERESGLRWEGEREERGSRLFPFLIVPRALLFFFFSIIAIFIGIPSGGLCGEEIDNEIIEKHGGGRDLKRG